MPAIRSEISRRQKRLLNLRGEEQIALECSAFLGRQYVGFRAPASFDELPIPAQNQLRARERTEAAEDPLL